MTTWIKEIVKQYLILFSHKFGRVYTEKILKKINHQKEENFPNKFYLSTIEHNCLFYEAILIAGRRLNNLAIKVGGNAIFYKQYSSYCKYSLNFKSFRCFHL